MSSIREGSKDGSNHSLAFRVMRLCRPALQVDLPLRCYPHDLALGEDDPSPPPPVPKDQEQFFSTRSDLKEAKDAFGINGTMVLPQAFGYISVGNHSSHDITNVVIKAELQTERQRLVLADNSKAPVALLPAGGRHDFIIEHDIKELGAHTLVCSAGYHDISEQKYLPQYFKFVASNPLSVRTKVRVVKDSSYLEACIENTTKLPLFLDHVRFDPAPAWQVKAVEPQEPELGDVEDALRGLFKPVNLVRAGGGTRHFLYHLTRAPAEASSSSARMEGGSALGKLEITWRTTLGEPGRLQTQQIVGNPIARKEVELKLVELPSRIVLERPFIVQCRLTNCTERPLGPLTVSMPQQVDAPGGAPKPPVIVVVSGPWSLTVPGVQANASYHFSLCMVALAAGVQRIAGIGVLDVRDAKPYDTLAPTEVYVEVQ
eukprot:jgi/Mesen1/2096/ME000151S01356